MEGWLFTMKKMGIVLATALLSFAMLAVAGCTGAAGQNQTDSEDAFSLFEKMHATASPSNAAYTTMMDNGVLCNDCHGMDAEALYDAYSIDADSITVENDRCIACHIEAAWPEELPQTLDTIRTDWTVYENAGSEEHRAWIQSNAQYSTGRPLHGDYEHVCTSCHTMHGNTQQVSCTSCHNSDQGAENCASCHGFMKGSEAYGCEGITTDEQLNAFLVDRLGSNEHVDSVFTAPEGWYAPESQYSK